MTNAATRATGGLNPEAQALLELFSSQGAKEFTDLGVLRARRTVERSVSLQGEWIPIDRVEDVLIPGAQSRIPLRLYHPAGSGSALDSSGVLILYLHGGGWVTGSVDAADRPCRMLAQATGAVVASVEYRRAPETPFPGPLEDCYSALQWCAAHAESLGIDPDRIVVMGESAGANLAAAVTLLTRERAGHPIAHQVLLYPCLLPAAGNPFDSYRDNASGYSLTAQAMLWFWDLYLPDAGQGENQLAAPLRARNLSRLPSATVITAEFDPLRDEGNSYATGLELAGVDVEAREFAGTIHGFFGMAGHLAEAQAAADVVAAALERRFALIRGDLHRFDASQHKC
jgi:acetyl esterase